MKKRRDDQGNLVELPPISVKEYFTQTHNYSFKYPDLPAMDVGRANKPVYLPLEVMNVRISDERCFLYLTNQLGALLLSFWTLHIVSNCIL